MAAENFPKLFWPASPTVSALRSVRMISRKNQTSSHENKAHPNPLHRLVSSHTFRRAELHPTKAGTSNKSSGCTWNPHGHHWCCAAENSSRADGCRAGPNRNGPDRARLDRDVGTTGFHRRLVLRCSQCLVLSEDRVVATLATVTRGAADARNGMRL